MYYDAFISYHHADLAFAEFAYRKLTDAGLTVWFDKARLNPGCNWYKEIEAGCEASRIFLPILTPRWKTSDWTKYETYGAEASLPLLFEGELREVLPSPLGRFQAQSVECVASECDESWPRIIQSVKVMLAQAPPQKAQRLSHMRFRPNEYFVGRARELLNICEELHQAPTTTLTQGRVRAITALGGVGKTTLVRHYAEKFWRCYSQLFWIDARRGLLSEFAKLAEILNPDLQSEKSDPLKAQFALRVLSDNVSRLLVIDGAEDEHSIQDWIPKTGSCHVLITSRFNGWSASVKGLNIGVLEPQAACELLVRGSGREIAGDELVAIDELARSLGQLPLALEQAVAYIRQQPREFGFSDYLRLYRNTTEELLAEHALGSTEYPDPVITTWKATVAKLPASSRSILRLCGFYATAPIPISLFLEGGEIVLKCSISQGPPHNMEFYIRDAVRHLLNYSMISVSEDGFRVHELVQTAERLAVPTKDRSQWLYCALDLLNNSTQCDPEDVRDWPRLEQLHPHALAAISFLHDAEHAELAARLLHELGMMLQAKGDRAGADPLVRGALAIVQSVFDESHPVLNTILSSLAQLLRNTDRFSEAEPLMRQVLSAAEASYGRNDIRVAVHLNNLGELLLATTRLVEAKEVLNRAIEIFQQSNIGGHPKVAVALDNLSNVLLQMSHLERPAPLRSVAAVRDKMQRVGWADGFERLRDAGEQSIDAPTRQFLQHRFDL